MSATCHLALSHYIRLEIKFSISKEDSSLTYDIVLKNHNPFIRNRRYLEPDWNSSSQRSETKENHSQRSINSLTLGLDPTYNEEVSRRAWTGDLRGDKQFPCQHHVIPHHRLINLCKKRAEKKALDKLEFSQCFEIKIWERSFAFKRMLIQETEMRDLHDLTGGYAIIQHRMALKMTGCYTIIAECNINLPIEQFWMSLLSLCPKFFVYPTCTEVSYESRMNKWRSSKNEELKWLLVRG